MVPVNSYVSSIIGKERPQWAIKSPLPCFDVVCPLAKKFQELKLYKNKVIQYLSKYVKLTDELENELTKKLIIREYSKGSTILKQGEICNECFFILKGLIRTYYIIEAEEITTNLNVEEQVIYPSCCGTKLPSDQNLVCVEDTVVCVGTPQLESEMFLKYPQLESLSRIIGEKTLFKNQERFDLFKMLSPEKRYRNLIENNPGLIQRVPQYQLASFLGIKPESLSRIRKRIM